MRERKRERSFSTTESDVDPDRSDAYNRQRVSCFLEYMGKERFLQDQAYEDLARSNFHS